MHPTIIFFSLSKAGGILATDWFEVSLDSKRRMSLARENSAWFRHPNGTVAMLGDSARSRPKTNTFSPIMQAGTPKSFGRTFPLSGYAMLHSPWFERPADQHAYLIFWAGEERPGEPATLQVIREATEPQIIGWVSPSYLERVDNAVIDFTSQRQQVNYLTLFIWGDANNLLVIEELGLESNTISVCW